MLKLLRYDIKDSYLEILAINAILLFTSLIVFLGGRMQSGFLLISGTFIWSVALSGVFAMLAVYIIKSFHTKLFTNLGYLTLATPVSIDKMLISKILTGLIWLFVTLVCFVFGLGLVTYSYLAGVSGQGEIAFFAPVLEWLLNLLVNNILGVFRGIIAALFFALSYITMLLFVLVLANTGRMKKHKLIKGILIYFALNFIMSVILVSVLMSALSNDNYNALRFFDLISVAFNAAFGTGFYFISRYLIKNKLELE